MAKNSLLIRILVPFAMATISIPLYIVAAVKIIAWLHN